MALTPENVQLLIWALEELADQQQQDRLWTGKGLGEMSSFEEVICQVFDDSGLGDLLYFGRLSDEYPAAVVDKIVRLHQLIKKMPQSVALLDIIHHPKMNDVRILAGELAALLKD